MAIPSEFPEWASVSQTQTVSINGINVNIDNKQEPTEEWKDSGSLYNENLPYPYINYQFNLIDNWVRNLDERSGGVVGDIHHTTVDYGADPQTTLNSRFGGTWTRHGSDTQAGQTIYVYEKTA